MTACHNGDNNNKGARLSSWALNHLQEHLQKRHDIQVIQFVRKKKTFSMDAPEFR